jgi:hypothetical protein
MFVTARRSGPRQSYLPRYEQPRPFSPNSAYLDDATMGAIARFAHSVTQCTEGYAVRVQGYAARDENAHVAVARAITVRDALIKAGVPLAVTSSYGWEGAKFNDNDGSGRVVTVDIAPATQEASKSDTNLLAVHKRPTIQARRPTAKPPQQHTQPAPQAAPPNSAQALPRKIAVSPSTSPAKPPSKTAARDDPFKKTVAMLSRKDIVLLTIDQKNICEAPNMNKRLGTLIARWLK